MLRMAAGDGALTMGEFKRAFRALGLRKRDGKKMEVDEKMFRSFDTNGDGTVSLEEFEVKQTPAGSSLYLDLRVGPVLECLSA
jgi:hypothetical protein